ncbi:RHS repeat protein [Sediminibacterium ginsengisoli]|uniref:YD repeat-containing protein n=1 Tax=Sediminibacterium ginsengisoli TaxID=413434 RepID=A0A1T4JP30_9BACT|nr:RHS repeat protein [Sediminibacterium ginsengisoli]SJZ31933.1 hypothetical protein SAMN04488132_10112 [Sediminibacterium ginsengisoli]
MRKLTIFLLAVFLIGSARSQNIFSALQLNAQRSYKTKRPKKIVHITTSFTASGYNVAKDVIVFDNAGMVQVSESYDANGMLKTKASYTNDTVHRIVLASVFERWMKFAYFKESSVFTYDNNFFLIGVTDKDEIGRVIRQTDIVCNEKGHPIELSLFDGNGNQKGKETATYSYDKNEAFTSVISNDGKVLSSKTIKISFTEASKFPDVNTVYNTNGDLIHWVRKNPDGSETTFEGEYTYDSFGNCTEENIFKVTVKKNGKRKREIYMVSVKEYTY